MKLNGKPDACEDGDALKQRLMLSIASDSLVSHAAFTTKARVYFIYHMITLQKLTAQFSC